MTSQPIRVKKESFSGHSYQNPSNINIPEGLEEDLKVKKPTFNKKIKKEKDDIRIKLTTKKDIETNTPVKKLDIIA